MPYVPSPQEARRLRVAIDRASFSEAERIWWMLAFAALTTLDGVLLVRGITWMGALGAIGGFLILYWRIRGGHLAEIDRELHGMGLRTEAQRAFTALMVRQVFTGRNPLRPRKDHDPFATWSQKMERAQAQESAEA